jgi:hypothetical protein
MPITVCGPYLFGFSLTDPFALPVGWNWVKDPEDWLIAIGPGGKRYIATKDELHLLKYSAPELAEENPKNYRPQ